MQELFQAAATNRVSREPWIALAAELRRRGDVRGDLADVQLALEDARGSACRELLLAEEKLLRDHAEHLWGPLAELGAGLPGLFLWRRGFLDSIASPSISYSSRGKHVPLPRALFSRALEHDAAHLCRYVSGWRKPKPAPRWIEGLHVTQTVVTSDVMALPRLRSLAIERPVWSAPLRHRSLEHLRLPYTRPVPDLIEQAELPGLQRLMLFLRREPRAGLERVARAVGRLAPAQLDLGLFGPYRPPWTSDDLRALEPLTDRLTRLFIGLPCPSLPFATPRLRSIHLQLTTSPAAVGGGASLPQLPAVEELHLQMRRDARDYVAQIRDRLQLQSVRVLKVDGEDPALAALAGAFDALEELAIMPMGLVGLDFGAAFFDQDAFPKVRTVSLAMIEQLPHLARSPLAGRVETLSLPLHHATAVASWLGARPSFPRLRALVVSGRRSFDAATRASLYESGHDVIWARTTSEAAQFFFTDRTEPGFPAVHG